MKILWIICLAFCVFTLAQITFGQTDPNQTITIASVKSIEDDFTFLGGKYAHNDTTKEMQLTENVSFTSKKFEFSGADKVIYNQATKKMTIYGCQEFTINGKVVIKNEAKLSNILEYTVGSDTVYLF